ncbi:hypothetical protein C2857_000271 [Epichloe festucae Fl1]|uniref:Cyanovirin-N domain-containing protein n=1 Tax=Epichloe festucae (strain Fl1) TaxID=877507 RepID=A0A7S9KN38_EPIFF|nr:hypothetical protein C2857_000271 [Epichloe festucae Fl1]
MKSSGIFFLPLALLSIGSEAQPNGFDQTTHLSFTVCNPKLEPPARDSVKGRCPGPHGKYLRGRIGLGQCLHVVDGVLRGGHVNALANKFMWDCEWHKASLIGSVYHCKCKSANGDWVDNAIDLDGIITYRNGTMHCDNYHGRTSPEDDPAGVLQETNEIDPTFKKVAHDYYREMARKLKEDL